MTCPRCGGSGLYRELGDLCCLACGTLRAAPNPDALRDTLRGQPPRGTPRAQYSGLTLPHEDQLAFVLGRDGEMRPAGRQCAACGAPFPFTGTNRRYCSDRCRARVYRGKAVAS